MQCMSCTLKVISSSSIFILMVCKFARCPLGPRVTLNALPDYAASLLHFLSKFCNTQCSLYNALFSSRPKSKLLACEDKFALNLGRWQSSSLKEIDDEQSCSGVSAAPSFLHPHCGFLPFVLQKTFVQMMEHGLSSRKLLHVSYVLVDKCLNRNLNIIEYKTKSSTVGEWVGVCQKLFVSYFCFLSFLEAFPWKCKR